MFFLPLIALNSDIFLYIGVGSEKGGAVLVKPIPLFIISILANLTFSLTDPPNWRNYPPFLVDTLLTPCNL